VIRNRIMMIGKGRLRQTLFFGFGELSIRAMLIAIALKHLDERVDARSAEGDWSTRSCLRLRGFSTL
jgi:hypothetical protein